MQEAIQEPTHPSAADPLVAAATRAETWAGEPFLRGGEDPARVLAEGTARRRALDDAIAEMDTGAKTPSSKWKVRYGLMLGLERILAEPEPRTAAGTSLRKHQIDALAGMLTELIAASQKHGELNGNGNAPVEMAEVVEEEEEDDEIVIDGEAIEGEPLDDEPEPLTLEQDPGAIRRYRFRHPTASGKTIAAAGFVEAARTLGVLILTHRRLLVSQFTRDLTTEGYGDRLCDVDRDRREGREDGAAHDPDVRVVRAPRRLDRPRHVPAHHLRRGAHGARGEDLRRDPLVPGADLHRHDGDRAADREAGQ